MPGRRRERKPDVTPQVRTTPGTRQQNERRPRRSRPGPSPHSKPINTRAENDMKATPPSTWHEDPKPVDYAPDTRRGGPSLIERAAPALAVIASHAEDKAGTWFVVATYRKEAAATSAVARMRKSIHKAGLRLPTGCHWEFGRNGCEVLARINPGEDV